MLTSCWACRVVERYPQQQLGDCSFESAFRSAATAGGGGSLLNSISWNSLICIWEGPAPAAGRTRFGSDQIKPPAEQLAQPAAFAIPSTAAIAAGDFFGNTGRASVREPGLVNFDESLFKNFPLRESLSLAVTGRDIQYHQQARFRPPQRSRLDLWFATFGKVISARDPREVQLALKLLF
jgi:hypothetical protein